VQAGAVRVHALTLVREPGSTQPRHADAQPVNGQ